MLEISSKTVKLTNSVISRALPADKEYSLADTEVKGLYVRVLPSGSRSFVIRKYGQPRYSFGDISSISIPMARAKAQEFFSAFKLEGVTFREFGRKLSSGVPTLNDVLAQYIAVAPIKESSKTRMSGSIKLVSGISNIPIDMISPYDIVSELLRLKENGVTDASLSTARTNIGTLYRSAIAQGVIDSNPTEHLRSIGLRLKPNQRETYFSPEVLTRLGNCLLKNEWKSPRGSRVVSLNSQQLGFIKLLLFTGARSAELLGLRVGDFKEDTFKPVLTFRNTKNGSNFSFVVDRIIYEVLMDLTYGKSLDKPIFPSLSHKNKSEFMSPKWINQLIQANLGKEYSLHDFRRTFATYGELAGLTTTQVALLLNHQHGRTITDRYIVRGVIDAVDLWSRVQRKIGDYIQVDNPESETVSFGVGLLLSQMDNRERYSYTKSYSDLEAERREAQRERDDKYWYSPSE